ncbi:aldehyde dehydrogenase [Paenibacillus thermoaerophilus]|nr:aldehyde dehydrogenase [Paenibacillus thermoaerophilus]
MAIVRQTWYTETKKGALLVEGVTPEQVRDILDAHRQFYREGHTRSLKFRLEQLGKLRDAMIRYDRDIKAALHRDLRKSEFEALATETGFALMSIRYTMKHLKRWMKPQKVRTPVHLQPSRSYIVSEPYGTVLIIGPFNYPFQLLIEPLIGAIAAGNCAVLKPSEHTPAVSAVIGALIRETFDERYIRVVEGEKETTSALIRAPFDHIFFTGSVPVGKIVMQAAAANLTPVTLELGGKSPVIVDASANLDLAAKRIMWGKLLNAGQTCISPDYVLVHESVKERLVDKMKAAVVGFYGEDASKSPDYGRIVNTRHFDRLATILERDREKIAYGGASNREDLYIEPTLIDPASWEDASMEDEIFGPILPILTYRRLDDAIRMILDRPKPLALYVFTEDRSVEREVLSRVPFGGGCVNDTIMHVANHHLPFGGVGPSGFGAYHGKHSFDVFSHRKSILRKSTRFDIKLAFPPYGDKIRLLKKILK